MDSFGAFILGLVLSFAIIFAVMLWVLWRTNRAVRSARDQGRDNTRTYIAIGIVIFSIIGVSVLGLVVILAATDRADASDRVMTAILPLLGTWVGTVMAFYFGRENYEAASQNARRAFEAARTTEEVLSSTPVSQRMIDFTDKTVFVIRLQDLPLDQARTQEKLLAMLAELEQKAGNVGATWHRVPIVTDKGLPLYVLHDSTVYEFITKQSMNPAAGIALPDLTLDHLFNDPEFKPVLNESVRLVSLTATMNDAKREMNKSPYCQDVFVTRSGARDEEALGWITNNIIEDAGRV